MKTLGLCFLFLSFVLVVTAPAQEQSSAPILNPDKAAIQKWLARDGQTNWPRIQGDRFILSLDDMETTCAYMRTYRVKREAPDSDTTRSAGYTTCVPMTRFAVKRSGEPRLKLTPTE